MITIPTNREQFIGMSSFLKHHAHVGLTEDLKMIGWFDPTTNELQVVIGMNGFMGSLCQVHIAMAEGFHFAPRDLLEAAAVFLFDTLGRSRIIGFVNSLNERAMKFDLHMGYEEILRLPGAHDDGGDLVVMSMTREQCKYLPKKVA